MLVLSDVEKENGENPMVGGGGGGGHLRLLTERQKKVITLEQLSLKSTASKVSPLNTDEI